MLTFINFAIILLLQISMQVCSNHYLDDADNDLGEPLFLTPFIKDGRIFEARQAASFPGDLFRISKGYSGFLTVNQTYNSNKFFLYMPTPNSPETAPVVIWLDGGPGVTSLFGVFIENGPTKIGLDGKLTPNQYSWIEFCNLIYIDAPVGVGYSFTEHEAGFASDFDQVGRDLYEAVLQLHAIFPQLHKLPLYVAGSSYAGKYVGALGYRIHEEYRNQIKARYQNFKPPKLTGLIFVSAIQDIGKQFHYGNFLFDMGFLDESGQAMFEDVEAKMHECIDNGDSAGARSVFNQLITNNIGATKGAMLQNLTGLRNAFFSLKVNYLMPSDQMADFVQTPGFRRLVHVGNKRFHLYTDDNDAANHLIPGYGFSVGPWVAELLNTYSVCSIHGQFDIIVPYAVTAKYYETMQFDGANAYNSAKRQPWKDDGELAGYTKDGGNLVEVMIRNGGHIITFDQPKWVGTAVKKCLSGENLNVM